MPSLSYTHSSCFSRKDDVMYIYIYIYTSYTYIHRILLLLYMDRAGGGGGGACTLWPSGPCGRIQNIGLGPEVVHLSVNYEPANCERRCCGRCEEDDIPMNRSVDRSVSLSATDATRPVIDIRAVTPQRFYMGSRPYNATAAVWDGMDADLHQWNFRPMTHILL